MLLFNKLQIDIECKQKLGSDWQAWNAESWEEWNWVFQIPTGKGGCK